MAHGNALLPVQAGYRFRSCVERRRAGEPVAYIIGRKEFWSLNLLMSPAVLIPRPETEHLVEHALEKIPPSAACQILELGTGSGAVALAIAKERPRCQVTATDISPAILRLAAENAERLEARNVQFTLSDWFAALSGQTFDIIVSNPPYVADDNPCLRETSLAFEPVQALRAGPEGLNALSSIAANARCHLRQSGWLLVEHGHDQQLEVASMLKTNGFGDIICHVDYAGQPRVTACRTASCSR